MCPMNISNKRYELKNINEQEFKTLYNNEFFVSCIAVCGTMIIFGSRNEVFIKKGGSVKKLAHFRSDVSCLCVDDGLICAGSVDGSVKVFSDYREPICSYSEHDGMVNGIAVFRDKKCGGKRIVSCSDDGYVKFYDMVEKTSYRTIFDGENYVRGITTCGEMLVTGSEVIRTYDLEKGEKLLEYRNGNMIGGIVVLDEYRIAFTSGNYLNVLDIEKNVVESQNVHGGEIVKIILYDDIIYTVSRDMCLQSFDTKLQRISKFYFEGRPSDLVIVDSTVYVSFEDGKIMQASRKNVPVKEKVCEGERPYRRRAYDDEIEYKLVGHNNMENFKPKSLRDFKAEAHEPITIRNLKDPKLKNSIGNNNCLYTRKKMSSMEKMLFNHRYKECVTMALDSGDINNIFAVLSYIYEHRGLKKTLVEASSRFIRDFLQFAILHFSIVEFSEILIESLIIITSVYNNILIENNEMKELLEELSNILDEEILFQENVLKTISFLQK